MKTKNYFSILFVAVLLLTGFVSQAQEEAESPWSLGAAVESRYIWRGTNLGGAAPSVQPSLSYTAGGFTVGYWGAFSTSPTTGAGETDLYLSYAIADMFTLTLTDYYFPKDSATAMSKFGNFDGKTTGHLAELSVGFKKEGLPISFLAAINLWGNDHDKDDATKSANSAYLEATYATTVGNTDVSLFAGLAINEKSTYYLSAPGTGVCNVGLSVAKSIKITDSFELPVYTKVIVNPERENIYMVFGFTL